MCPHAHKLKSENRQVIGMLPLGMSVDREQIHANHKVQRWAFPTSWSKPLQPGSFLDEMPATQTPEELAWGTNKQWTKSIGHWGLNPVTNKLTKYNEITGGTQDISLQDIVLVTKLWSYDEEGCICVRCSPPPPPLLD